MATAEYKRYLASREWALRRRAVTARSGGLCERHAGLDGCRIGPRPKATAVHHLTYEHIGAEPLEDLLHVCDECHDFLSGQSDIDPVHAGHEHNWSPPIALDWEFGLAQGCRVRGCYTVRLLEEERSRWPSLRVICDAINRTAERNRGVVLLGVAVG